MEPQQNISESSPQRRRGRRVRTRKLFKKQIKSVLCDLCASAVCFSRIGSLRLGFYDERLREGIEMDSGLTFRKAGCKIMVQPDSVVCLYYPLRVRHAIDVEF
jgi:hypothetical protein